MKLLTNEQQKSYENAKVFHICKKNLKITVLKIKIFQRQGNCYYTAKYRGAAHSICNLKYSVPEEISIVLHDGSNYDYHFIVKELAEAENILIQEKNTEKYITFRFLQKEKLQ